MKIPSLSLLLPVLLFLTSPFASAQVRITEVNITTRTVEVTNFGATTVNFAATPATTWFFCHRFTYPALTGTIAPGQSRQFTVTFNQTSSDICLYNNSNFGSTGSMEDFIQFGAAFGVNGRESVAVAKGIWTGGSFFPVPAAGRSFHAKAQPPASGVRNSNWFVGLPHQGFPVPGPELESFTVTGGQWRLIVKSFHLLPALKAETNAGLSGAWQLQTPTSVDLGAGRFDLRFPATGARQFSRVRAEP